MGGALYMGGALHMGGHMQSCQHTHTKNKLISTIISTLRTCAMNVHCDSSLGRLFPLQVGVMHSDI